MRDPIIYKRDISPLEAMSMAEMQAHGQLDAKIRRHMEDNVRHITPDERETWNDTTENTKSYLEFKNSVESKIREIVRTIKDCTGLTPGIEYLTKSDLITYLQELGLVIADDEPSTVFIDAIMQRIAEKLGIERIEDVQTSYVKLGETRVDYADVEDEVLILKDTITAKED